MKTVYNKDGNQVNFVEENDLDSIKIFINPIGNSASSDANKYINTGIYRIFDIDKNIPITNPNGILLVFSPYIEIYKVQIYANHEGSAWLRIYWDRWYTWKQLN